MFAFKVASFNVFECYIIILVLCQNILVMKYFTTFCTIFEKQITIMYFLNLNFTIFIGIWRILGILIILMARLTYSQEV